MCDKKDDPELKGFESVGDILPSVLAAIAQQAEVQTNTNRPAQAEDKKSAYRWAA